VERKRKRFFKKFAGGTVFLRPQAPAKPACSLSLTHARHSLPSGQNPALNPSAAGLEAPVSTLHGPALALRESLNPLKAPVVWGSTERLALKKPIVLLGTELVLFGDKPVLFKAECVLLETELVLSRD
jgi:hypothetical protein